jgi:hypothetical protein
MSSVLWKTLNCCKLEDWKTKTFNPRKQYTPESKIFVGIGEKIKGLDKKQAQHVAPV